MNTKACRRLQAAYENDADGTTHDDVASPSRSREGRHLRLPQRGGQDGGADGLQGRREEGVRGPRQEGGGRHAGARAAPAAQLLLVFALLVLVVVLLVLLLLVLVLLLLLALLLMLTRSV